MNMDAANNSTPTATHVASDPKPIWVFTPSRTDPKDLEFILVQRQELIQDAVERVRESALTDHKHHLLFVGPRGCGKTHLITLIVSRLTEDEELTDRLRIAWLNEDETCTTLLEFLLKIHAALVARYPEEFREDNISEAYELKADAALDLVVRQLLSTLGPRTLLVVAENLDALFEGLGDTGQKNLRAFIQEHPKLSIVATAQRLVQDLSSRTRPFFGFFQTEHLKTLEVDEANQLLQKIAQLQGRTSLVAFLATNQGRSRVRALHHLSGGNHRIYIVLSQFITRDTIDSLLGPFMKMVDELTPYYQERIRWLPALQRKIVEYLCSREGTVPVKDIAKRLFASPQTISSQLQDLREKGYVEANQRGRESLYEISEPLMRICVEVKDNQRLQPLRLLVDFLRVWYDDTELKRRLGEIAPVSESAAYFASAIQRNGAEGNLRQQIILDDFQMYLPKKIGPAQVDRLLSDLKALPESAAMAMQLWAEGKSKEARQCFHELLADETDPSRKDELCDQVARALINRGMTHGQAGDAQRAIEDYTAAIGLAGAPARQVANALLARGIAHGQAGDTRREIEDCTAVIGLAGAPVEQVAWALLTRSTIHGEAGDTQRAIEDCTAVIGLAGAPVEQVARALVNRGITHGQAGDTQRAIEDCTAVIGLAGAPVEQVARALVNRGITHGQAGDTQRAIEDCTAVIGLAGAPVEEVARALVNRGITHGKAGDTQRAIEDYTAVIGLAGAPVEQVARALVNRGITHGQAGDTQRAIEDCTAVIGLAGAPVEEVARALLSRGIAHGQAGDAQRAIEDYTAVIGLAGAPVEQVARALLSRGIAHGQAGDTQRAIEDYTAVIGLAGAPVELVARALVNRGITHGQAGDTQRAIEDCTAVIGLAGAPVEQVARALLSRGIAHGQAGDTRREIEDYTAVIGMAGAPVEQVARALLNRGITHGQAGDTQHAIEDCTAAIGLSGASVEQVARALLIRGMTHGQAGDTQRAIEDYTAVIGMAGAPVEQVARALFNRGTTYFRMGRKQESASDLEALTKDSRLPLQSVVDAHLALAELCFSEGRWSRGFDAIEASLTRGETTQPAYRESAGDLVGAVFSAGLSPDGRRDKVAELLRVYGLHNALSVLGEAVVKHVGRIFRAGHPFPATDNLEGWALAWEEAAVSFPDFSLSVRLLRAGVDYVKAGGKEPGVLLSLPSTERAIVEQALGLSK